MKTPEENSMTNRFMMSLAATALIAGAGFANAQGTGKDREQPSAGSTAQQSAPSSERGNSAAEKSPSSGMKATQSEEKKGPSSGMKATQSEEKSPGAAKSQRAEDKDKVQGQKSKSSENEGAKGGKDMKAEGGKDMKGGKMNAEQKGAADSKSQTTGQSETKQPAQTGKSTQTGQTTPKSQTGQTTTQTQPGQQPGQTQSQSGTSVQSQTTGQAGAAAKLSTEQRTQITTVIRDQRVAPVTNVNFSISVGTRIPRDVSFHVLPERVVAIYPEWRGFKFIIVREQILIIDPNTFEIVAILEV